MALDFQNVDVRFTKQGLDTRTQPKMVLPGNWLQLQNVALAEDDTPRLRDGVQALVPSVAGNALVTRADQLLSLTGESGRSLTTSGFAAVVNGEHGYCQVRAETALRTQGQQDQVDCEVVGDFVCWVWRNKSAVTGVLDCRASVVHIPSGAVLQSDVLLRSGALVQAPRVAGVASATPAFIITYVDTSGTPTLFGRVVTIAAPQTLGVETTLVSSANLRVPTDSVTFSGLCAVVYGWADGVTSVRTIGLNQNASIPIVASGPTNVTTEAALPIANLAAVAVEPFSSTLCGIFTSATGATALSGVAGATIGLAWGITTAATVIDATVNPTAGPVHLTATPNGVDLSVYVDQVSNYNTARLNQLRWVTVKTTLAITTAAAALVNSNSFRINAAEPSGPQGPWIAGKAFTLGTRLFLPVAIQETYNASIGNVNVANQQNTLFILDGLTGVVVARCLTGTYGNAVLPGVAPNVTTPCGTPSLPTSGDFIMFAPQVTRLLLSAGRNISPTGIARVTMTPLLSVPPLDSELGPVAEISGGALTQFDGRQLSESGFHLYPEGFSCVMNGGAGAVSPGVHQVLVVYEWTDNAGQRHQSASSTPVSVTAVGAPQQVIVLIPTLQLQQRPGLTCVPYMTTAAGTSFYRCTQSGGLTSFGTTNDTTVTNVQFIIQEDDAALSSNELLYFQPDLSGVTLANTAPPPCTALGVFDKRLWVDVADQPGAFRFSQQIVNATGLQWSDALGGAVDVAAGGIVGFCAMDEKQIIFCEKGLRVITGNGPNSAGLNSGFSAPLQIQSDGGCVEARSILSMPMGIIYKSTKGWRLLGRDLVVRDIGDGAKAFDSQNVTSATLLMDREECRFSSTDAAQLVYCYRGEGQWSYSYLGVNYAPGLTYNPQDTVWWQALYDATGYGFVSIDFANGIHRDNGTQFDAIGAASQVPIPKFMVSSWLKLGSIGGYQRVRWLYLTATCRAEGGAAGTIDSNLTIGLEFDDVELSAPNQVNNYTFSPVMTTVASSGVRGTGIVDMRHKLHVQKCKSVQLTISEDGYEQNCLYGFQALTLNVGIKRGTKKLPAAQGVG